MAVNTAQHRQAAQRRRPELAAFLRSRRARVTPADVGMAPGLRRRTPGLRREEVAQLSGVGVTWYTWLEQGRPINASVQVLDAIARTLRLDRAEREHLYHLAEVPYVPDRTRDTHTVSPEVQGIIDALDPLPAVVYNARYDILAYNAGYQHLFPSMLLPTAPSERNVLWQLFVNQRCCVSLLNLDEELPVIVATLRGGYGRHVGEPEWEEFLARLLAASDHFARLWRTGDVAPPGARIKVVQHASVGEIRMLSTSMQISGAPETRVVVYTPDDEESRGFLERLRAIHDPLIGCSAHARPLSAMRAERAQRAKRA
ncbi:helix-turn-helix transcriptional regulator [Streptomyces coffeae]|uniref:Helix-turn-helix domain-containing protein n=1 Tax=Streptomyces coffeae TaxID=621382 RepID=A0ABS1NDM4_9ACTN|nr:helix-turn-helix transcriptional regulator [Streptomyces coffeae]MBL1098181.1 helix-turn-helix domain-containing protein [Streptomyces coffeae]